MITLQQLVAASRAHQHRTRTSRSKWTYFSSLHKDIIGPVTNWWNALNVGDDLELTLPYELLSIMVFLLSLFHAQQTNVTRDKTVASVMSTKPYKIMKTIFPHFSEHYVSNPCRISGQSYVREFVSFTLLETWVRTCTAMHSVGQ